MKVFPLNIRISAFDGFTSSFANLSNKLDRLGKKAKRLGRNLSIGITAPIALFARESIATSLALEAMTNKMTAAMGGAEEGARQIKRLKEESQRMGIEFLKSADDFAMWAASSTRAGLSIEQTNNIFTDMAETSVALRLSTEKQNRVFAAMSQIAGKGVLSMEELRQQLGDHIPGAVTIAAKSMGKTTAEFIKMVSRGEVVATEFLPGFAKAIREELGGSFEEASQGAAASLARYENSMVQLRATMASSGLMDALISLTDTLSQIAKAFNNLSPGMKKFIAISILLAGALGPVLFLLGSILTILPLLGASFAGILVIAPWIALVALLVGLAAVFTDLQMMAGGFGNALMIVGGVIIDFILSPLKLVLIALAKVGKFLKMDVSGLEASINYSFGEAAAAHAVRSQQKNIADRTAIIGKQENIGAGKAIKIPEYLKVQNNSKADINVKFENMPKGARSVIMTQSNANITLDQGISMGENY